MVSHDSNLSVVGADLDRPQQQRERAQHLHLHQQLVLPARRQGASTSRSPTAPTHNFGFTTEFHTTFTYNAGKSDSFSFTGDDDVFVFINNVLAIDLGGVHAAQTRDGQPRHLRRGQLRCVSGRTYKLDIFQAERRTTGSNFAITTTLTTIKTTPEPGTLALAGVAALGLGWRSRRRRAAQAPQACARLPAA